MAFSYTPMEKQEAYFLISSAPSKYGYSSAHLRYAALQGAINLVAQKGKISTIHFGLVGTYGQLSFTPKNMQDSK